MKQKNKAKRLKTFQDWYDKMPQTYKNACKRPGSYKHR